MKSRFLDRYHFECRSQMKNRSRKWTVFLYDLLLLDCFFDELFRKVGLMKTLAKPVLDL